MAELNPEEVGSYGSGSSSTTYSSTSSVSEDSDSSVDETLGLPNYTYNPTEKLKEANAKLSKLEAPEDRNESRASSKIRFNEQIAVKSSSKSHSSEERPPSNTLLPKSITPTVTTPTPLDQVERSSRSPSPVKSVSSHSSPTPTPTQNQVQTPTYTDDFDSTAPNTRPTSAATTTRTESRQQLKRPKSAPARVKKMKVKMLWDPANPPANSGDLPAYMRPQTGGGSKKRGKHQTKTGQSEEFKEHMRRLNKEFPHIKSSYKQPEEQRRAAAKREKIRKEREELEKQTRDEEEKERVQFAHEVWVSWYETSIEKDKQVNAEKRAENRQRIKQLREKEETLETKRRDEGLEFEKWCETKIKSQREQAKKERDVEQLRLLNEPSALEKMKANDKAFRRWLRLTNKKKKQHAKEEELREKLRRQELRREAKAQKALAAIRAAQDHALSQRTFVF